ncbi:GntR family transcriptional regulator [Arthrobacter sp. Soil762]|uniref:GntR family transcriptional regulator n=1 Tax=Arthrobacter sp. Soil762 TaxID=1736401 RepID=UPI0006F1F837|nr:GntR family transcriptional regulator [Arthrobacter sp. Soil762]KRE72731.1 hypothetical protein ASG77_08690 [Arthrobacter sp. Soil762]
MSMFRSLDRDSPIPAYHQLVRMLRARIVRGDWPPGTQLPTELQLAAEYEVSRSTIRQAMTELAKGRFVVREQGKGTFALQAPQFIMTDLSLPLGLAQRSRSQGLEMVPRVLSIGIASEPPAQAFKELKTDGPLIELSRLMTLDGSPAAHVISWIPAELVPGIDRNTLVEGSVSATLSSVYQFRLGRYDNQFEVIGADAERAEILDADIEDSVILLSATCLSIDNVPLEFSRAYWKADRVRFRFGVDVSGALDASAQSASRVS